MSPGHVLRRGLYHQKSRVVLPPARRPIRYPTFINQQAFLTASLSRNHTSSRASIKTAGYSSTTLAFFFGGCILSASILLYRSSSKPDSPDIPSDSQGSVNADTTQIMVGAIPPGRPGNLTPEQETKLQEFWTRILQTFGVTGSGGDVVEGHSPESSEQTVSSDRADAVGPEKKKKKHTRLFSRKHREDAQGGVEADGTHTDRASTDSEDKFGLTKEYNLTIASTPPEQLRQAFWSMVKHDNPDGLLLRFLRARKWDVENALIMLISTMNWRAEQMHVDDDIVKRGEGGAALDSLTTDPAIKKEGKDFMTQLRMGKSFLHGKDKEGRPMCYVRVRLHKQGEQSEQSIERYTVYVIETARLLLSPAVDTATVVFDMTGFSMANMDYTPVKFMIRCFEANYPESLGAVLVHKSPWLFQGIWKIIRGWLDPVVASKVHFTNNVEELEHFISRDHIIKELGGEDTWTYQYVEPNVEENNRMLDDATRQRLVQERAIVVKDYELATHEWIRSQHSSNGVQQRRTEMAERLKTGYWQLDPYLRARTLYDRTGMIREGGTIQYYDTPNSGALPAHNEPIPAGHGPNDLD